MSLMRIASVVRIYVATLPPLTHCEKPRDMSRWYSRLESIIA